MVRSVRVAKRLIDVAGSLLGLAITVPFFPLIAAAVYLDSPGAIFIRQRRAGQLTRAADDPSGEEDDAAKPKFREFWMLKFRSMRPDAEEFTGPILASEDDPRVTRVGRFLRKTRIDEVPQFINVLQGRMSVVGPRPHAVAHTELYRKLIKGYMFRHKVRPGITGWAQVNGLRGETETLEKMERRIAYDLDYLRRWSLQLDLQIVLKTLFVVLDGSNAY